MALFLLILSLLIVLVPAEAALSHANGKMIGAGTGGVRPMSMRNFIRPVASSKCEAVPQSKSFYHRIGSPKHVLAPMVAQSDLPFRLMCEHLYNVHLSYTQMIHANNFSEDNGETFRMNHLDVYNRSIIRGIILGEVDTRTLLLTPSQLNALDGLSENDIEESRKNIISAIEVRRGTDALAGLAIEVKPTVVQIAAHDPDVAVKAAKMILERSGGMAAAIDLNLGCPQSIARKGRYGSFLHDESPEDTYRVLSKLRSVLPDEIGVTAKIRLPPTQSDFDAGKCGNISEVNAPQTIDERIRCLIDCGVDLITVHGRTRWENKNAVGAVNWGAVSQCVASARSYSGNEHYPIFSNGGIEAHDDIQQCFEATQASGVMSSESLLEVPGLFRDAEAPTSAEELLERQLAYAEMYLDYATVFPPLPGSLGIKGGSFNVIRSHLFKMLHRYLTENADLRSWMGNQDLSSIKEVRELLNELKGRYANLDEEQMRLKSSWNGDSSWYRRHRGEKKKETRDDAPNSLSIEKRKQLSRIRIQKLKEQRMKMSGVR